jgi:citrate synthase
MNSPFLVPRRKEERMDENARLEVDGKIYELPIVTGSEGERAVDIRNLRSETGLVTLDPGYKNTGSCQSTVTFIDGDQGILRYRGIPIEELAEKSTFLEVAYLLIQGNLPSPEAYAKWVEGITRHTMLHEDLKRLFGAFPKDAHPMAVCAAVVAALSTFYPEDLDPQDPKQIFSSIERLIAKFPTIAAYSYKHSIGQPFLYPDNRLNYVENFLRMTFGNPAEEFEVDPVIARAIDVLLILHADHEQNCSTSTVRLVGSSRANLFASISAGINALWGPLHGGANQQVIEMLRQIGEEGLTARQFVEQAKDRDDTSRLMGFGHRVYRNYDPRAQIIKAAAKDVLDQLGVNSQLLEHAVALEEIALKDEYFIQRRLYPNVDFYSGVIFQALGIPLNSFTVLFAMGRLPGWIAHWVELANDQQAIGRPRQIYTGEIKRPYVPIDKR